MKFYKHKTWDNVLSHSLDWLYLHLSPAGIQVGGEGLAAIGQLRQLVKLDVVSSRVLPPASLSALSNLSQLRHLEVGSFDYITSDLLEVCDPPPPDPACQPSRVWANCAV
jgi:hypothetical protein